MPRCSRAVSLECADSATERGAWAEGRAASGASAAYCLDFVGLEAAKTAVPLLFAL